ncbi:MAG: phosphomannomutase [Desulfovibrionales bacterium]|nr:phosphomannomutase [Desulfovibrionales bacterium]
MNLSCFKAYDIRGRVPDELDESLAYRIGRAYASFLHPARVVVGHDIRLSSPGMADAVARGLLDAGVDVFFLGECGTEEVYFAVFDQGLDGGIMVTASHNPKDYNGMKFVREDSRPISGDTGLFAIRDMAAAEVFEAATGAGQLRPLNVRERYRDHLLSYVDRKQLTPLSIVTNAGNGGAGAVIDLLEPVLPFTFHKILHEPDGNFPNGVPNPLLPQNRDLTSRAVVTTGADLGLAWDGDFDRCFFFDGRGRFIEGYYVVGLLGEAFSRKFPGAGIIHDPRLIWNTIAAVSAAGGRPLMSKTGHAFIKERMRLEDAVYGGEMSAHHYFRDFAYCDSGMIPWLLVAERICISGKTLAQLVDDAMAAYPASGEINRTVRDAAAAIAAVEGRFGRKSLARDTTDGLSLEFADWRFNLRSSNTEPVLRLNVESRGDCALMAEKTAEILAVLDAGE